MILKGEKVVLRPVRMDDAPRFVKWFSDPAVNKFVLTRGITLKKQKDWIRNLKKDKRHIHFCIDTKDKVHIGSIGLKDLQPRDKDASYGIMIGDKNYWGRGYGKEATIILLNYAFLKLKLHKIYLIVYIYNKRAIQMYKKLGFKIEGNLRDVTFWNGRYWNGFRMSILENEWKRRKK